MVAMLGLDNSSKLVSDSGETILRTSNSGRFDAFMSIAVRRKRKTICLVKGEAGIGKSMCLDEYLLRRGVRSHIGISDMIKVIVRTKVTRAALGLDILEALHEVPRGSNAFQYKDQIVEKLVELRIIALFFDEADRLSTDSFNLIREIYDDKRTQVLIVLVGLPQFERTLGPHNQLKSRVGLRVTIVALDEEEIITDILPHLEYPGWKFDPKNEADIQLGRLIWKLTSPSLRNLTNLLDNVGALASIQKRPHIDRNLLLDAFRSSTAEIDQRRISNETGLNPGLEDPKESEAKITGDRERVAQQRQDAKRRDHNKPDGSAND